MLFTNTKFDKELSSGIFVHLQSVVESSWKMRRKHLRPIQSGVWNQKSYLPNEQLVGGLNPSEKY